MVFQDYALWPHLVIRANVTFALHPPQAFQDRLPHLGRRDARPGLASAGWPNGTRTSCPAASSSALLMIRPTGVRLCASHTGEHHLAGTVADVAFRGRGYEHAVDIPGHGRLTGVFSEARAARGDPVGLRLDSGGCHLFAATPDSAATPAARVAAALATGAG